MTNPFQSAENFVSPSLNRVRVANLPGDQFPDQLRGQIGFTLLSSASLRTMIKASAAELGLSASSTDLLQTLNSCFNSPSASVRVTAQQIAEDYGRRLALLLLTLKQADPANRHARPSWANQHWEFWQNITTIHIGGGLLAGALGPVAIKSAQDTLRSCNCGEMSITLSPFGAYLTLAGLARTAPANTRAMLLLDFGQTDIKRAIAHHRPDSSSELHLLPNIPVQVESDPPQGSERENAEAVAGWIVNVVDESRQEARCRELPLSPVIGISLACYLVNGHPPPSEMGYYGRLQLLTDNVQTYLNDRISRCVDCNIQLNLFHDGTAAGLAFAGAQHTAALMLGTAIGVGFPPESDRGLLEAPLNSGQGNRFSG